MLDRVLSFFRQLNEEPDRAAEDDPKIAAAALMFHVVNADGMRDDSEWKRLKGLLAEFYQLDSAETEKVASAGERADLEAIDLYSFTSVLNRHLDREARVAFIGMLWEVVFADGNAHELEEHTLWRVAELLGVERSERITQRKRAQRRSPAT